MVGPSGRWEAMTSWLPPEPTSLGLLSALVSAPEPAASSTASPNPAVLAVLWLGAAILLGGTIGWCLRRVAAAPEGQDDSPEETARADLRSLSDTSRRMILALEETEICRIAVEEGVRLANAEVGAFVSRSLDGLTISEATDPTAFSTATLQSGLLVEVMNSGRPASAVTADDPAVAEPPKALAAVPVTVASGVAGAILVLRAADRPFSRDEVEALALLAPVTGAALVTVRAQSRSLHEHDVDKTTQLHNRRRLQIDLQHLDADVPVAFAVLRVDLDVVGATGRSLRDTADRIASQVRRSDTVYRYGNDEFAILMPHTDQGEAERVAERVISKMNDRAAMAIGLVAQPQLDRAALTRSAHDALAAAWGAEHPLVIAADSVADPTGNGAR